MRGLARIANREPALAAQIRLVYDLAGSERVLALSRQPTLGFTWTLHSRGRPIGLVVGAGGEPLVVLFLLLVVVVPLLMPVLLSVGARARGIFPLPLEQICRILATKQTRSGSAAG